MTARQITFKEYKKIRRKGGPVCMEIVRYRHDGICYALVDDDAPEALRGYGAALMHYRALKACFRKAGLALPALKDLDFESFRTEFPNITAITGKDRAFILIEDIRP